MEIRRLYISPGHNFFGHHGKEPSNNPTLEVDSIECIAGRGLTGDRFLDYKDKYKGQITFFAEEVFEQLCAEFNLPDKSPSALRRNVITRGQDLRELIGRDFEIQGVKFRGTEECRPCYWMDRAVAPGTEKFLRGRGGLRARILSDGTISVSQRVLA